MTDFIKKNSIAFRISREMAIDYGMVEPTPEEAAKRDAEMAVWRRKQRDDRAAFLVAIEALRGKGGATQVIFDLHSPNLTDRYTVTCPGDDYSGYDGEPPEWPCPTIVALAEHHDIALPSHTMPGAEYED